MSRQIILDTETTGIHVDHGHRIIEIGCVELINRRVTQNKFQCYINPEREVDAGAIAVHGITTEFLKDKPLFASVASEFMAFIDGCELIIHNAPFDVGFINKELQLTQKKWQPLQEYCRITCTLSMARKMHAGMKNNLDALCKRYAINNQHREYHGALLDSYLLAQVYLAMTEGQRSFFDESELNSETAKKKKVVKIDSSRRKVVIEATPQELEAHEEYLKKMLKQGKCLWEERRDG